MPAACNRHLHNPRMHPLTCCLSESEVAIVTPLMVMCSAPGITVISPRMRWAAEACPPRNICSCTSGCCKYRLIAALASFFCSWDNRSSGMSLSSLCQDSLHLAIAAVATAQCNARRQGEQGMMFVAARPMNVGALRGLGSTKTFKDLALDFNTAAVRAQCTQQICVPPHGYIMAMPLRLTGATRLVRLHSIYWPIAA